MKKEAMEYKLEPEYEEAYRAWEQDPTPQMAGPLIRQLNPVIGKALTSYGSGIGTNPTMKAKAKLMAMNALSNYDPAKGQLKTHMLSQLRGLQRVAAAEKNIIKLPEQIAYDFQKLNTAEQELEDELGRTPSVIELADYTNYSPKRIEHIRKAQMPINTGTIMEGGENSYMPATKIPGYTKSEDAWIEYVYDELPDIDRALMDAVLGLHGKQKIPLIVLAKQWKVSPSALSQRLKKIQSKIDARDQARIM